MFPRLRAVGAAIEGGVYGGAEIDCGRRRTRGEAHVLRVCQRQDVFIKKIDERREPQLSISRQRNYYTLDKKRRLVLRHARSSRRGQGPDAPRR